MLQRQLEKTAMGPISTLIRRKFSRAAGFAAFAIMALPFFGEAKEIQKPNIVFLLVDDLGWADVGYQGKKFKTPNIDRLAQEGMIFTDAYAASPVCSPTRASIMTGKSPARLKLTSHIPSLGKTWTYGRPQDDREFSVESGIETRNWLPESEVSIAEALKPLGYATGFFGKWHLGHEPYHPIKQGFDEQKCVTNWGQPPSYYSPYWRKWPTGDIQIDDLAKDAKEGEYLTDRLTDEACSFISKHKEDGPFLCYLSYYTVHDPLQPRKDLKSNGKYGGMIAALDESVGRIMSCLEKEHLEKNTVVVLMSDNGGVFDNSPLRSHKGSIYEGGIREPMIVKWPGVTKPGSKCSVPVISTDFFPSFVEMAGGDPTKIPNLDGESFVPLLQGEGSLKREALFWHYPHHRGEEGYGGAIRKGNYKLIEKFSTGQVELYDLSKDIGEKQDLAAKMPEKAEELRKDLIAWRKGVGASMPQHEKAAGAEHVVRSPDGNVVVRLDCKDSRLSYSLFWNDREIIQNSALSLVPDAKYAVLGAESRSVSRTWNTVWGQFSTVQDRCEEIVLKVDASGVQADLICRVYDDGVGFRFVVPQQQNIKNKPVDFVCEYNSAEQFLGWFPNGEDEPLGPVPFGEKGRHQMPAVIDTGSGVFLGLLESDLYTAKEFKTAGLSGSRSESKATLTSKGLITPWRVILLGTQPGALLTSTVPLNLAAECKLEDTSWIKAGKSLWDWRVHGYKAGDFTYGIDTASYKRFIDFAAENNIRYFLIDDTWFEKVVNGKLIIKPEVDMNQIMDYARKKGVDIILYYDRLKGATLGDEALFKLYSEFGAAGIKYGFMGDNAEFTRQAVEQTAENKLLVDFHDHPCPMTGISRTLPNAVTREFCHSQQDCRKAFSPTAFLKMAMINALSGPIDQCNGAYGLNGINEGERQKGPSQKNSFNSTVVSETARTLIIANGLIVLPDAPEEYEKKADLFEFIREMPATWDESRVINSKIGETITTARRSGEEWFISSVMNENGGSVEIPLEFLEKGKTYEVTFYEDAAETHYITNRESYQIRKDKVTSRDVIEARMAPGGGHCMWIRPSNKAIDSEKK
jgi:glucan 1,4-alpha-glucosidase